MKIPTDKKNRRSLHPLLTDEMSSSNNTKCIDCPPESEEPKRRCLTCYWKSTRTMTSPMSTLEIFLKSHQKNEKCIDCPRDEHEEPKRRCLTCYWKSTTENRASLSSLESHFRGRYATRVLIDEIEIRAEVKLMLDAGPCSSYSTCMTAVLNRRKDVGLGLGVDRKEAAVIRNS